MTHIIQRIIDNKELIEGIEVNDTFFTVNYIAVDEQLCYDEFSHDDIIINANQVDNNGIVTEWNFTVGHLINSKVKLYKFSLIEG